MSDLQQLEKLLSDLKDGTRLQRRTAAFKLGAMRNPEVVPDLLLAAGDEDSSVRTFIASALATVGLPAMSRVKRALSDSDWRVRKTAVTALGHMNLPAAIPDLLPMLEDEQLAVQTAAATALAVFDTLTVKTAVAEWHHKNQPD